MLATAAPQCAATAAYGGNGILGQRLFGIPAALNRPAGGLLRPGCCSARGDAVYKGPGFGPQAPGRAQERARGRVHSLLEGSQSQAQSPFSQGCDLAVLTESMTRPIVCINRETLRVYKLETFLSIHAVCHRLQRNAFIPSQAPRGYSVGGLSTDLSAKGPHCPQPGQPRRDSLYKVVLPHFSGLV